MKQSMAVLTSKNTVSWYTPSKYIEMARQVMGNIDLDPASCDVAQSWINADVYYANKPWLNDNGLALPWKGNIWVNWPFDDSTLWAKKMYSEIDKGSKVNHLSYVGDTTIGKYVNIGAGTITCNYDGVNKHKTYIADYAFIGSCTQLVAPVNVGEGATIGAGSTITRDAPPHKLTLARVHQRTVEDWERPKKIKE